MSGDTRYIGKTIRIDKRVAEHVRESRDATRHYHRAQWIRGLVRVGHLPVIETLCRVPADSWQACERFLIATARHFDFPLTNGTCGGDGMDFSFAADQTPLVFPVATVTSPPCRTSLTEPYGFYFRRDLRAKS